MLQALGLQLVGAVITTIGYFAIGLPLGGVLAFDCCAGLGLNGIWWGNAMALLSSGIATHLYIFFRVDWANEVRACVLFVVFQPPATLCWRACSRNSTHLPQARARRAPSTKRTPCTNHVVFSGRALSYLSVCLLLHVPLRRYRCVTVTSTP